MSGHAVLPILFIFLMVLFLSLLISGSANKGETLQERGHKFNMDYLVIKALSTHFHCNKLLFLLIKLFFLNQNYDHSL